jgi:mono/diheme cytochrome c family protein
MRFNTLIIIPCILAMGFSLRTFGQAWVVPDDQKAVRAPFKFTPDMQKKGDGLYSKNCQSCHGQPGKDNWAQLTPPPGDLAKEKVAKETDGEMFYKITAGRPPMPEFRNILTEDERWWVIAYVRTFHAGYVQPEPGPVKAFDGRTITLHMKFNEREKKIIVSATELIKENTQIPAEGVDVSVWVKRYFGLMQATDVKTTDPSGNAVFSFPEDIPGNRSGFVDLVARVNDPKGTMRTSPATASLAIGKPTDLPGLTETRAWWSVRSQAPVWVILTYSLTVIIVWGFILYIVYTILQIRKVNG